MGVNVLGGIYIQYRSKLSSHSVVQKCYKVTSTWERKCSTTFSNPATFFTQRSFDGSFYRTVSYCLLYYAHLTICAEDLLLLHPVIARLSTETANFVSFRSPACLFLDAFRHSLLLLVTVIFTVVSLSVTSSLTCFKTGISADTVTCFSPARAQIKIESGLREEDHQKNSGLLTQKLLAASNGELYTAM